MTIPDGTTAAQRLVTWFSRALVALGFVAIIATGAAAPAAQTPPAAVQASHSVSSS